MSPEIGHMQMLMMAKEDIALNLVGACGGAAVSQAFFAAPIGEAGALTAWTASRISWLQLCLPSKLLESIVFQSIRHEKRNDVLTLTDTVCGLLGGVLVERPVGRRFRTVERDQRKKVGFYRVPVLIVNGAAPGDSILLGEHYTSQRRVINDEH